MMKKLFTQLRNEWRGKFFLALELLVVFVVLWYIVDWCCVTARFVLALALSWLLMALMIVVGVCYPARRAMQVQPAEALHDE